MPFEGSNYTVNRAMYEVISYGCGYTGITNDEGSYIFGSRHRAFVISHIGGLFFSEQWRTYLLLYVYREETNEQNEPLDA